MAGDISGVRIIPPVIEFMDAEANVVHAQTVTVQNISKCSKQIKFHGPNTNVSELGYKILKPLFSKRIVTRKYILHVVHFFLQGKPTYCLFFFIHVIVTQLVRPIPSS